MLRVIFLGLFLTSCASSDFAAFQQKVTSEVAGAKDNEARLAIDAAGAVGLRAWARLKDPRERCGLLLLSGIDCNLEPSLNSQPTPRINVDLGEPLTGDIRP